jgi:hypothetical protein
MVQPLAKMVNLLFGHLKIENIALKREIAAHEIVDE